MPGKGKRGGDGREEKEGRGDGRRIKEIGEGEREGNKGKEVFDAVSLSYMCMP